ncbi:hypothetical protein [Roseateles sp.]|uniref:hypothetical protein n=1 Tax=Roseateles sp. TaxID=1971397 RepID=UPI0025E001FE|nr:hypothetical protein [Roseateles sp.]MBV8036398.1 hypothetical protein [Roseateles sp.]MBV8470643.1 hypothetical protein [Burkholderiaceae bacterium]
MRKILALTLAALVFNALGGCVIIPERHWGYRHYGDAGNVDVSHGANSVKQA